MERIFVHCDSCNDHMEVEFVKGNWYCENCGKNLTKEVEKLLKKKKEVKNNKTIIGSIIYSLYFLL